LQLNQIEISAQPIWIKTSVLEEVYKSKKLDRINILDPSSNADIASAFETHPWVKSATRVRKYGGGGMVTVDLIYRRPLAMIQVPYLDPESSRWKDGFYPLDAFGVVLPVNDFTQQQIFEYLRIEIEKIDRTPEGMGYADARVHQALKLTSFLESSGLRKELGLEWLRVRRDDDVSTGKQWTLQLSTDDHRLIVWGHAPGEEVAGEESADKKLSRISNWLKSERQLASQGGELNLLKRSAGSAQTTSSR
jgi:hypothetical protein